MKLQLLFIAGLFSAALSAQKTRVQIEVSHLHPYCGGARPTEEIEKEASTPKPFAGKTFIILSEKKKIDSVRTDDKGLLTIKLKKGSYRIYEAWRYNLETPGHADIMQFDRTCLLAEWEKVYATLIVEKKKFRHQVLNPIVDFCEGQYPCLNSVEVPPGRQ